MLLLCFLLSDKYKFFSLDVSQLHIISKMFILLSIEGLETVVQVEICKKQDVRRSLHLEPKEL